MLRFLPFVVAVVLLAICTLGQAWNTQRYTGGTTSGMNLLDERFDDIRAITSFGDWERQELLELSEDVIQGAGAVDYMQTSFINHAAGQMVSVFLICGFGRDVAVHTPERCFVTADMKKQDEAREWEFMYTENDAEPDAAGSQKSVTFKTARFVNAREQVDQRTFWAWNSYRSADERWNAPRSARVHYGGGMPLVKVYITVHRDWTHDKQDTSTYAVAQAFATKFLPEVSKILGAPIEEKDIEVVPAE